MIRVLFALGNICQLLFVVHFHLLCLVLFSINFGLQVVYLLTGILILG